MNTDQLAARRRAKAMQRVDDDCRRSIAELELLAVADRTASQVAASKRRHPSRGRPYDQEAEG